MTALSRNSMGPAVPVQRCDRGEGPRHAELWNLLERVKDPEIPVLSIVDLGILRDVSLVESKVTVAITPTYSGCPAMAEIRENIRDVLSDAGFWPVRIETVLHPAWSSDWLTDEARARLRGYGIAPPASQGTARCLTLTVDAQCPRCGSENTQIVSDFGSTPCKALHKCLACLEPFESFKCI